MAIIDYDYSIESDIDVIYYIKDIFLLLHKIWLSWGNLLTHFWLKHFKTIRKENSWKVNKQTNHKTKKTIIAPT